MFTPVRDLSGFDEETIDLYKKRVNDPRTSYLLSTVPRRNRHNLPVVCDTANNTYLQKLEAEHRNFGWYTMGLAVWFSKFKKLSFFTNHCFRYSFKYIC